MLHSVLQYMLSHLKKMQLHWKHFMSSSLAATSTLVPEVFLQQKLKVLKDRRNLKIGREMLGHTVPLCLMDKSSTVRYAHAYCLVL